MPIYEFECDRCDYKKEVIALNEYQTKLYTERDNIFPCPNCGSGIMDRVVSTGTSFRLKGDGWTE